MWNVDGVYFFEILVIKYIWVVEDFVDVVIEYCNIFRYNRSIKKCIISYNYIGWIVCDVVKIGYWSNFGEYENNWW